MITLFFIGIIAGIIEASAGGSGLISLPAIMFLGYEPIEALATSKFQYVFGAVSAIRHYSRAKLIEWRKFGPMLVGSIMAGAVGAFVLSMLNSDVVILIMPILLIVAAIYFLFSPRISDETASPVISIRMFGLLIVPLIAFYDGFFGVGSASLYMAAFVSLLGMSAKAATANTKLLDFSSGAAALLVLAFKGHVLLLPGLALGAGQIIGAHFGASLVLRWGARWVKPLLVIVTLSISIDLLIRHREEFVQVFEALQLF